jgi:hypothetical protein
VTNTNCFYTKDNTAAPQIADVCECGGETQMQGEIPMSPYWSRANGACVIPEAWHGVWQYNNVPQSWTQIGGDVRQIYAGAAGLVATDTMDNLMLYSGTPQQWTTIGGPGAMFAVDSTIIGLHPDAGGVSAWNGGNSWTSIGGPATTVTAGGGLNLATDVAGQPYLYNGSPNSWTRIGGPGDQFITGGGGIAFALTPDHQAVFQWVSGGGWSQVSGPASELFQEPGGGWTNVFAFTTLDASKTVSVWDAAGSYPVGGPGAMFAWAAVDQYQNLGLFGVTPNLGAVWETTGWQYANPGWTMVGNGAGRLVGGGEALYATQSVTYCLASAALCNAGTQCCSGVCQGNSTCQ